MAGQLAFPTGNIRTHRSNGPNPYGFPWKRVADYADIFERVGMKHGINPYDLACLTVIESDTTHYGESGAVISRYDADPRYPSVGMTQIKPGYHQWMAPDVDAWTPEGNIELAAVFLSRHGGGADFYSAIGAYHPGIDPNGTTPGSYVAVHRSLRAEIKNATQSPPTPAPAPPKPVTEQKHPYDVIGNGVPWSVEYGFLDNVGLNYYGYGVGHGTSVSTDHTGDDVLWPDETLLHAPAPGRVTCVGWEGEVTWGQGCGYFEDVAGGIGNVSILLDSGHKMVLGHCSSPLVNYGDRVTAGQPVARSGVMNGPHTHIEVAVNNNGTYWLVDPAPALAQAMGGTASVAYAERLPVPQPAEFEVSWTVTAAQDGVPVLQRANLNSDRVAPDLTNGETFEAVYIAIGNDLQPYWISKQGGRVPVASTTGPAWLTGAGASVAAVDCPPDRLPPMLQELAAVLRKYQGPA